ncbi:signal peptidase I [Neobacillus pocheonensis]|uniref:signal peptidase I n=1 Tax=Neobacillus pocheonensis TaxID=363869 RepID=UPI003D28F17F
MGKLKKTFKVLGNVLFIVILIFTLTIGFFVIKSKINGEVPNIAGNKIYVVLTGSMVPVFDPGSIVIDKKIKPEQIVPKDIVTFIDPRDSNKLITHRVVQITNKNGSLSFITKGDANDSNDPFVVPAGNVIGKVNYWVPYLGYILEFSKSSMGMKLPLIIIPGSWFLIAQLMKVIRLIKEEKRRKYEINNKEIQS